MDPDKMYVIGNPSQLVGVLELHDITSQIRSRLNSLFQMYYQDQNLCLTVFVYVAAVKGVVTLHRASICTSLSVQSYKICAETSTGRY